MPDTASLQARRNAVFAAGGEGLVLHLADALWARSEALRKLKFQPDEEGTVLEQLAGRGR